VVNEGLHETELAALEHAGASYRVSVKTLVEIRKLRREMLQARQTPHGSGSPDDNLPIHIVPFVTSRMWALYPISTVVWVLLILLIFFGLSNISYRYEAVTECLASPAIGHESMATKDPGEKASRDIRRETRKQFSWEKHIGIVLKGLRSKGSIEALCCREGIAGRGETSRQCV
jgi:hypothetical protein